MKIVYLRQNGELTTNTIFYGGYNKKTDEILFFELMGFSGEVKGGKIKINGRETYKRLFIQRVYPYVKKT